MKKKLPEIFKGKVGKAKNQKQSILNTYKEEVVISNDKNIDEQIDDIFSSENYVYKADVQITMVDGDIIKKTIIGRTNNSLITMDDELIDVKNISQIDFLN